MDRCVWLGLREWILHGYRKDATIMTDKEATLKLIEIIGELLYYIPDMGWTDSSRFARRLIDIKEGLSNESRQSN